MRYVANPVEVEAHRIVGVSLPDNEGRRAIELENGLLRVATPEMMSRTTPIVGDYWVIQLSDGYIYLNPKDVFERKYTPYAAYVGRG